MKIIKTLPAAAIVYLSINALPASGPVPSPWAYEEGYFSQIEAKFTFGLENMLLGWSEIISEPLEHCRHDPENRGLNLALGVSRGILNSLAYTIGGAIHFITFPLSRLDIPLPDSGVLGNKFSRGTQEWKRKAVSKKRTDTTYRR